MLRKKISGLFPGKSSDDGIETVPPVPEKDPQYSGTPGKSATPYQGTSHSVPSGVADTTAGPRDDMNGGRADYTSLYDSGYNGERRLPESLNRVEEPAFFDALIASVPDDQTFEEFLAFTADFMVRVARKITENSSSRSNKTDLKSVSSDLSDRKALTQRARINSTARRQEDKKNRVRDFGTAFEEWRSQCTTHRIEGLDSQLPSSGFAKLERHFMLALADTDETHLDFKQEWSKKKDREWSKKRESLSSAEPSDNVDYSDYVEGTSDFVKSVVESVTQSTKELVKACGRTSTMYGLEETSRYTIGQLCRGILADTFNYDQYGGTANETDLNETYLDRFRLFPKGQRTNIV